VDLEERHVQNMMRALDIRPGDEKWTESVDLQELFFRLTLDSVGCLNEAPLGNADSLILSLGY
jgi:hypothetical protein